MKILVAEDDDTCQQFIRRALGPLCREMKVTDTLEGLNSLLSPDIDAIWLDLVLKDANTLRSIPSIRSKCPNAAIIVATGWGDIHRQESLDAGADVYVQKGQLKGFDQKVMANLISQAALCAMSRGVDTNKILQNVAEFLKNTV